MMSNPYGLYRLGCTRHTMVGTMRSKSANFSKSLKLIVVWIVFCNENMKLESLVIVDQHATVNISLKKLIAACHVFLVG
jgi:formate hydrogenlyase subunit 4